MNLFSKHLNGDLDRNFFSNQIEKQPEKIFGLAFSQNVLLALGL